MNAVGFAIGLVGFLLSARALSDSLNDDQPSFPRVALGVVAAALSLFGMIGNGFALWMAEP